MKPRKSALQRCLIVAFTAFFPAFVIVAGCSGDPEPRPPAIDDPGSSGGVAAGGTSSGSSGSSSGSSGTGASQGGTNGGVSEGGGGGGSVTDANGAPTDAGNIIVGAE